MSIFLGTNLAPHVPAFIGGLSYGDHWYNDAMAQLTAIIIKGNPKFIEGNSDADNFYREIQLFLEAHGYQVSFDNGEPYTSPEKADLWIGHSRGVDRLRFAPEGTSLLKFGSSDEDAINHPDDSSLKIQYPSDVVPNEFHYVFTDEMKRAILEVTERIKSGV